MGVEEVDNVIGFVHGTTINIEAGYHVFSCVSKEFNGVIVVGQDIKVFDFDVMIVDDFDNFSAEIAGVVVIKFESVFH